MYLAIKKYYYYYIYITLSTNKLDKRNILSTIRVIATIKSNMRNFFRKLQQS